MKKKHAQYATFWVRFAITVCICNLCACLPPKPIPEERFEKAEELVDAGTQFLRERNLEEAQRAYELAAELAPVAAAVDGQGCVALLEGRFADAEELFTEAYEMDATYDEALRNLALLRELEGKEDEARAMYREYLANNPSSVEARNNLTALEYDKNRDRMGAMHELAKALTLSDQVVIRENLATLTRK